MLIDVVVCVAECVWGDQIYVVQGFYTVHTCEQNVKQQCANKRILKANPVP